MRVREVGESKCGAVMVQIEVYASPKKGADFQQVLYYKKATKRLLNWETQMNLVYRDVLPIRRNSIGFCNKYCKDYL
jgi:hypothetical protein